MARPQHPHPLDKALLIACWLVLAVHVILFVLVVAEIGRALPLAVRHGTSGTWMVLSFLTPLLTITAVVRRRRVSALLPAFLSLLAAGAGIVALWAAWMGSVS